MTNQMEMEFRFYWPGCHQDVELCVHQCDSRSAQKGLTRRSHAPLQQYQAGPPMERVGVDTPGHFPTTDQGLLCPRGLLMDFFTDWPDAHAVRDRRAATTAERLTSEMFCCFGVPEELHTDHGPYFEAGVISKVCQYLGIKQVFGQHRCIPRAKD